MSLRNLFIHFITLFWLSACQSQAVLPYSDVEEIRRGRSILSTYTCEDLIEKAEDTDFSLQNLARIRAMAKCPEFKFDLALVTDLEKKLYSSEIESFQQNKPDLKGSEPTVAELRRLLKKEKKPEDKFSLYKNLRTRYKRSRTTRPQYIKTTEQLYRWAQTEFNKNKKSETHRSILYDAALIYIRTMWTEGETTSARKAIQDTSDKIKNSGSVAELYYLEGRIDEENQNFSEAVADYDRTIADIEKYKPSGLSFTMERLLWLKAWIQYKQKNYSEAQIAFQKLIDSTSDLSEKSRARFYLSRSLKYLEKPDEAKRVLEEITAEDHFSYYGLVAYRELGQKLPALASLKSSNSIEFDLKLSALPQTEREIFFDLVRYREFSIAEKAISIMSQNKNDRTNMALYLAQKAQIFMPIFRQFAQMTNQEKMDLFIAFPELIFPQPYREQVSQMAEKTNLPPSLIYSIMKQESAFNERARSPADAFGLMQVIPGLAKQLSRKFEVPYRAQIDLYDPEINIQLGSYELMEQVRKQNGQLTYVAAAYNAGPNALSNWLKNRKREDILEFIEEIPYDETKTYVKLIARNKLFYERISNRDKEHDFPADFLN